MHKGKQSHCNAGAGVEGKCMRAWFDHLSNSKIALMPHIYVYFTPAIVQILIVRFENKCLNFWLDELLLWQMFFLKAQFVPVVFSHTSEVQNTRLKRKIIDRSFNSGTNTTQELYLNY